MLTLLSEEELDHLHHLDIAKQKLDGGNDFSNDRYTRKWKSSVLDAQKYWAQIKQIDNNQLLEVIKWLSCDLEPATPGVNKPTKIQRLARVIKYEMSPKQRAVAYSILNSEYNKRGL